MTPDVRMLVAGNWKMNGTAATVPVAETIAKARTDHGTIDMALCVPSTLIERLASRVRETGLIIGGQDCHMAASGAHTGDVSAEMLVDAGAQCVIVGHSERRADHDEPSELAAHKARAAIDLGLQAIICIGETQQGREAGRAAEIVLDQLAKSVPDESSAANTVIAYEPVWAIGTGLTASSDDIAHIHGVVRDALRARFGDGGAFRILYGGSVKPGNATEIFSVSNVDGGLIGGASLKADDFLAICNAASKL